MNAIKKETKDTVTKQAAILEAGFEIFAENGFARARLDDVAQRAGVAKGTLYLYFDSKEDLFKAVVLNTLHLNIEPMEKILDEYEGPVIGLLDRLFDNLGRVLTTTRIGAFPKMIFAEANNFPELATFYRDNVILRIHSFFTKVIEKGISQGEFRNVDAAASARILMSPFLMLALVSQTPVIAKGMGLDAKSHIEAARDILENGLKA